MPCPGEPPPGAAIARQVQAKGVADRRVLRAIGQLDRERFLPPDQRGLGDEDRALPIGLEQTISQPFIVAAMTEALELSGAERVLEIGTGSGYQTALLALLARAVYSVERLPLLSLRARGLLDGMGFVNVHYLVGDGSLGWPDEAPFDRILVAASAPQVPPALFAQLAEGGLLVAPVGMNDDERLVAVRRAGGRAEERVLMPCRFVPLIGRQGWSET